MGSDPLGLIKAKQSFQSPRTHAKKTCVLEPSTIQHSTKPNQNQMANFTSAINALVAERDRVFLVRVSEDFNLPFEQLSKLYLETAEQAIKVPRKYTKKPKAVAVAVDDAADAEPNAPKAPKEPKAKAEKQKCTACTSKKDACKFSALKGEVFCKRHLRTSQEAEEGTAAPKAKPVKKAAKAEQPVHTHTLTENAAGECSLCESHGNPLEPEADFEVVIGEAAAESPQQLTVAARLAAILAEGDTSDEEAEEASSQEYGLTEEAFEDE